jgi:hypothetical protein
MKLKPRDIRFLDSQCLIIQRQLMGVDTVEAIRVWVIIEREISAQLSVVNRSERAKNKILKEITNGVRNFLRHRLGEQSSMPFPSSFAELRNITKANTRMYKANEIARPGNWDTAKQTFWPDVPMTKSERERSQQEARKAYLASLEEVSEADRKRERTIESVDDLPIPEDENFQWPSTDAIGGDGGLSGDGWPQQGLLSYVGYRVGQSGLDIEDRQNMLDLVYERHLPSVNDADYMGSWGYPGTAIRLRKMAESIAAFCRNQKRRDLLAISVEDWEYDLDYLKRRFYIGHYDFEWPSTEVD